MVVRKARVMARLGSSASPAATATASRRSEEHTSELQSPCNLVCRLLLEKKKQLRRRLQAQPAPAVRLRCPLLPRRGADQDGHPDTDHRAHPPEQIYRNRHSAASVPVKHRHNSHINREVQDHICPRTTVADSREDIDIPPLSNLTNRTGNDRMDPKGSVRHPSH